MSVNSAAVLRLMGRGGGPVGPGAPRGRSTSRGRGEERALFSLCPSQQSEEASSACVLFISTNQKTRLGELLISFMSIKERRLGNYFRLLTVETSDLYIG